jgi:hypothetical protein
MHIGAGSAREKSETLVWLPASWFPHLDFAVATLTSKASAVSSSGGDPVLIPRRSLRLYDANPEPCSLLFSAYAPAIAPRDHDTIPVSRARCHPRSHGRCLIGTLPNRRQHRSRTECTYLATNQLERTRWRSSMRILPPYRSRRICSQCHGACLAPGGP